MKIIDSAAEASEDDNELHRVLTDTCGIDDSPWGTLNRQLDKLFGADTRENGHLRYIRRGEHGMSFVAEHLAGLNWKSGDYPLELVELKLQRIVDELEYLCAKGAEVEAAKPKQPVKKRPNPAVEKAADGISFTAASGLVSAAGSKLTSSAQLPFTADTGRVVNDKYRKQIHLSKQLASFGCILRFGKHTASTIAMFAAPTQVDAGMHYHRSIPPSRHLTGQRHEHINGRGKPSLNPSNIASTRLRPHMENSTEIDAIWGSVSQSVLETEKRRPAGWNILAWLVVTMCILGATAMALQAITTSRWLRILYSAARGDSTPEEIAEESFQRIHNLTTLAELLLVTNNAIANDLPLLRYLESQLQSSNSVCVAFPRDDGLESAVIYLVCNSAIILEFAITGSAAELTALNASLAISGPLLVLAPVTLGAAKGLDHLAWRGAKPAEADQRVSLRSGLGPG
ncbi:hypothetical protein B0H19DRAFT_1068271 [Mycena capillaripes]|nr:hypothetical protein B0H19DRAFT_1068271 [Mycena capillaripes]